MENVFHINIILLLIKSFSCLRYLIYSKTESLLPTQQLYELDEFSGSIPAIAQMLFRIKEEPNASSFLDIPEKLNNVLEYIKSKSSSITKHHAFSELFGRFHFSFS